MRWKLIAGNVLALLIVGLVGWLVARSQVAEALGRDVEPTVQRSVGLFDAVRTAEGERFKSIVAEGAQSGDARSIFDPVSASEQVDAAFRYAQNFSREIGAVYPSNRARAADFVAVTTADGHVLARNVDINQDRNLDLRAEYELIDFALGGGGRVARDFIKYRDGKWYDTAVAPILANGALKGLLVVGYEIGDSIAAEDKQRLGVEVGYLTQEANQFSLHSLSFGTQGDKDALLRWANGAESNLATVFNGEAALAPREITIGDSTYVLSAKAIPGLIHPSRPGRTRPGFIVLSNLSAARAPATGTTLPIVLMMVLGLVLVGGYNLMMANYLLRPIEEIEEGLLRIINGDRDHRIEVQHAELGGIVFRLNQLVSELTGAEEETDESGRISRPPPRPAPAAPAVGPVIDESSIGSFNPAGNPADAQLLQVLSTEPAESYYPRLRREYLQARAQAGLGSDGMSDEQFAESVRASEQMLAQKHALTLVRFRVTVQGSQVVFRPVPIR